MVGTPELLMLLAVMGAVTLVVLYLVVRLAVRDGTLDAGRRLEEQRAAEELRLRPEPSRSLDD